VTADAASRSDGARLDPFKREHDSLQRWSVSRLRCHRVHDDPFDAGVYPGRVCPKRSGLFSEPTAPKRRNRRRTRQVEWQASPTEQGVQSDSQRVYVVSWTHRFAASASGEALGDTQNRPLRDR
jgi:hypothetical protein